MKAHFYKTTLRCASLFLGASVLSAVSAPAFAQDNAGAKPATDAPPPAEPPAPAAAPAPVAPPVESSSAAVERMPAEAFWPAPYLRGIYGGSLWLSSGFHGLQWPYYRKTGIGVSGDIWVDTAYEAINRGDIVENPSKERSRIQQGRAVIRVTPTYTSGDWFVQGQVELVANKDQTLAQPNVSDTDDLWIRAGQWNKWDIKLGRFQAWEIYHLGMGLDLNTFERKGATDINFPPPDIYGVTGLWDRPPGVGDIAAHGYFTNFLRVEGLGQFGSEQGKNSIGGRLALILDLNWLKFKVGAEYKKLTQVDPKLPENSDPRGYGAALQYILDPWFEIGINAAQSLVDHIDTKGDRDLPGSFTTTSYGFFANARPFATMGPGVEDIILGVGADHTNKEDLFKNSADMSPNFGHYGKFTHDQAFVAVQYIVAKQLWVKLVGAYAKAHLAPSESDNPPYDNTMYSIRLRVQYLF